MRNIVCTSHCMSMFCIKALCFHQQISTHHIRRLLRRPFRHQNRFARTMNNLACITWLTISKKTIFDIIPPNFCIFFFCLEGSWGQPEGSNFPSPWASMLALRLECSTAALTTPRKVVPIRKLVELKMLDFRDRMRTGISILTSAADQISVSIQKIM